MSWKDAIKTIRNEILLEIKKILVESQKQELNVDEDTQLGMVGGPNSIVLSSLEYVEFIVAIEETFAIIVDFDIDLFVVRDIINYIITYNFNSDAMREKSADVNTKV